MACFLNNLPAILDNGGYGSGTPGQNPRQEEEQTASSVRLCAIGDNKLSNQPLFVTSLALHVALAVVLYIIMIFII